MLLPISNKLSPRTTPLHVYLLVMQMLKDVFTDISEEAGYPYKYTDDFNSTGVVIDVAYNKESKVYGKKPTLVVNGGGVVCRPAVIGDLAKQEKFTGNKIKATIVESSVVIKVISRLYAEVDILANEVFNFLVTVRSILPEMVPIQGADLISMSSPTPMEQEDHMYVSIASLSYSMPYLWEHKIPQTLLNGINLYLNNRLVWQSPDAQP